MLGYPDSNQERQDQNLQCYHYTIPQGHHTSFCLNAGAKVLLFFELASFFAVFFHEIQKKTQNNAFFACFLTERVYLCIIILIINS